MFIFIVYIHIYIYISVRTRESTPTRERAGVRAHARKRATGRADEQTKPPIRYLLIVIFVNRYLFLGSIRFKYAYIHFILIHTWLR